jgi:hypothetical protein
MGQRKRCPKCGAIGTWRVHSPSIDTKSGGGARPVRWLCKWCGWYFGPDFTGQAIADHDQGCWTLPYFYREGEVEGIRDADEEKPLDKRRLTTPQARCHGIDPWAG